MFSYLSPEQRVRKDHPLRAIGLLANDTLTAIMERVFERSTSISAAL